MADHKTILDRFGGLRGALLLGMGFVVGMILYHWPTAGSGEAMTEVGTELGLEVSRESQRWQLNGRIDDIGVKVETTTENLAGDTHWYTDFKLYAPGQPHGKIVGATLRQKAISGLQDTEWLSTGDEDFDKAVFVEGDPAVMLKHLKAEARSAVRAATDAGWALDSVTWTARESGRVTSAQKIRTLLDLGLAAASAMRNDNPTAASFDDQSGTDPLPGNTGGGSEPVTQSNAVDALSELNTPRSLEAAILLAQAGDDRQEVRNRLVSAVIAAERLDEVIELLGKVGGQVEIAVLSSVKGEHAEAAKDAVSAIQERL